MGMEQWHFLGYGTMAFLESQGRETETPLNVAEIVFCSAKMKACNGVESVFCTLVLENSKILATILATRF